ncbi:hypothetical protein AB0K16_22335 [Nonomuraea jabiensis]|uniref:deoxynucleotide monophosphate kinase family protein n=1 Tax=Nonomuraea jabiensis TaxID=882448 RepID=UPI0034180A50
MIVALGINGFAGSGKDTLADALVENYGFTKIAFADPLREVLMEMNPLLMVENGQPMRLCDLLTVHGWDDAKALYPEVRQAMVMLGQAMRNRVNTRIWINHALNRIEGHDKVVFSDVRQLNEAQIIKDVLGAELIHISRPGVGPANSQEMQELPPAIFSWNIVNDKDVTALRAKADILMSRISWDRDPQWRKVPANTI